ncbi:MAG: SDR family oxidoreductase [Deltaproteobacteria bacterium]|jgi:NAD(P)-dependent dehydrogenase (short-subunit alcohol dehydrogenase family)|nr:SDR family oxidoreductase [Deltaproteobacteria bacterium]
MRLKDKVAVVTGASKGIGAAIVTKFLKEGAKVVAANRNVAEGEAFIKNAVSQTGGQAIFSPCDVKDTSQIRLAIDLAVKEFGTLDIMVNNAAWQPNLNLLNTTDELFDETMATNARSVFAGTRDAAKCFIKLGKHGVIINLSSTFALVGSPGYTAYHTSKGFISSLTRGAAIALMPHDIRVNALIPGSVETPGLYDGARDTGDLEKGLAGFMAVQPLKRFGRPEEIAAAAVFLASDEASLVYGANMVVDGGYTVI